ncbi:MAG: hypothetical protein ABIQ27_07215 [Flavobacterium sp.]
MNFKWSKVNDRGQYENGFVDMFEAIINDKKAVAIITYLPQFEDKKDQNALLTVLLEGDKINWTKGNIKNIFYDVENEIKNKENLKYRVFNSLDYMMTQVFYMSKLERIEYLSSSEHNFL